MDSLNDRQMDEISITDLARSTGQSFDEAAEGVASLIKKGVLQGAFRYEEYPDGTDDPPADLIYVPTPGETYLDFLERLTNYAGPAS